MSLTKPIRCTFCGRFIAYADFDDGRAMGHQVTPDSEFTSEVFEYWHRGCMDLWETGANRGGFRERPCR